MPKSSRLFNAGVGFALGAAVLFGVGTPLAKVLLDRVQPWMLTGLLYVGASGGLLIIYLLARLGGYRLDFGKPLKQSDWRWMTVSILTGNIAAPVLLMFGLLNSPASTAALFLNFEGVFTALIAWLAFGQRLSWRFVGGIALITAGGIVLSQAHAADVGFSWGSLAVLGTCLAWGTDNNLTHAIADRNLLHVTILKSGVAAIVLVPAALLLGERLPSSPVLSGSLAVGFLTYGVTLTCYVLALRYIGAATSAAIFAIAPFVSAAIAIVVLGDRVTLSFVAAALLMAIGVTLCLQPPHDT